MKRNLTPPPPPKARYLPEELDEVEESLPSRTEVHCDEATDGEEPEEELEMTDGDYRKNWSPVDSWLPFTPSLTVNSILLSGTYVAVSGVCVCVIFYLLSRCRSNGGGFSI